MDSIELQQRMIELIENGSDYSEAKELLEQRELKRPLSEEEQIWLFNLTMG